MSIHTHWRNKQLGAGDSLLWQETMCLDFLKRHPDIDWRWYGQRGNFYQHCQQFVSMSNLGQGVVIINYPVQVTPRRFIDTINILLHKNPPAVYLAINRYEFIPTPIGQPWPETIAECMDLIVSQLKYPFTRVTDPNMDVGGFNFVGVHGLDIYTYENNQ
jgi:hypothetical protein